jgi:hypothetical protein
VRELRKLASPASASLCRQGAGAEVATWGGGGERREGAHVRQPRGAQPQLASPANAFSCRQGAVRSRGGAVAE